MPVVFKFKHQGEVRRAQVQQEEITYGSVLEELLRVWPELGAASAKYTDEEGDLCTLCSASFSDFAAQAEGKGGQRVFRLELSAAPAPLGPAAAAETSREEPREKALGASPPEAEEPRPREEQRLRSTEEGPESAAPGAGAAPGPRPRHVPWADWGASPWRDHGRGPGGVPSSGGWPKDGQEWLLKPQRLLWVISRLRATEGLSGKSAASLVVHFLPKLIANVAERPGKLAGMLQRGQPFLGPLLEDLRELASGNLGLEVAFLEEAYSLQRAQDLLDWVDLSMPAWAKETPLEHDDVTCDGCNRSPLQGMRFKCRECPNYDLCGECYANRPTLHLADCAGHQFQCIIMDWESMRRKRQEEVAWRMPPAFAKGMMRGSWPMKMAMKGLFGGGMHGRGKGGHMGWWSQETAAKGAGGKGFPGCCGAAGEGQGHHQWQRQAAGE